MSTFIPTITDSGLQAVLDHINNGSQAALIAVGLGTTPFTPSESTTAIPDEQSTAISGGRILSAKALHVSVKPAIADTYDIYSVGFYIAERDTDNPILLAVYADDSQRLSYTSQDLDMLLRFNLYLDALPENSIVLPAAVTDSNTAPATNSREGMVALADITEVTSGSNDKKAINVVTWSQQTSALPTAHHLIKSDAQAVIAPDWIADAQINTEKLATASITSNKLSENSIASQHVQANNLSYQTLTHLSSDALLPHTLPVTSATYPTLDHRVPKNKVKPAISHFKNDIAILSSENLITIRTQEEFDAVFYDDSGQDFLPFISATDPMHSYVIKHDDKRWVVKSDTTDAGVRTMIMADLANLETTKTIVIDSGNNVTIDTIAENDPNTALRVLIKQISDGTTIILSPITDTEVGNLEKGAWGGIGDGDEHTFNGLPAYLLKNPVKLGSHVTIIGFNPRSTIVRKAYVGCRFIITGDNSNPVTVIVLKGWTFDGRGGVYKDDTDTETWGGDYLEYGKGAAFYLSHCQCIRLNCHIINHSTKIQSEYSGDDRGWGGGLYLEVQAAHITANHIHACQSVLGGAVSTSSSLTTVGNDNNTFSAYHCRITHADSAPITLVGSAFLYCHDSHLTAYNCVAKVSEAQSHPDYRNSGACYFCRNSMVRAYSCKAINNAPFGGAADSCHDSLILAYDCQIESNIQGGGGGVAYSNNCYAIIHRCSVNTKGVSNVYGGGGGVRGGEYSSIFCYDCSAARASEAAGPYGGPNGPYGGGAVGSEYCELYTYNCSCSHNDSNSGGGGAYNLDQCLLIGHWRDNTADSSSSHIKGSSYCGNFAIDTVSRFHSVMQTEDIN